MFSTMAEDHDHYHAVAMVDDVLGPDIPPSPINCAPMPLPDILDVINPSKQLKAEVRRRHDASISGGIPYLCGTSQDFHATEWNLGMRDAQHNKVKCQHSTRYEKCHSEADS